MVSGEVNITLSSTLCVVNILDDQYVKDLTMPVHAMEKLLKSYLAQTPSPKNRYAETKSSLPNAIRNGSPGLGFTFFPGPSTNVAVTVVGSELSPKDKGPYTIDPLE